MDKDTEVELVRRLWASDENSFHSAWKQLDTK